MRTALTDHRSLPASRISQKVAPYQPGWECVAPEREGISFSRNLTKSDVTHAFVPRYRHGKMESSCPVRAMRRAILGCAGPESRMVTAVDSSFGSDSYEKRQATEPKRGVVFAQDNETLFTGLCVVSLSAGVCADFTTRFYGELQCRTSSITSYRTTRLTSGLVNSGWAWVQLLTGVAGAYRRSGGPLLGSAEDRKRFICIAYP